VFPEERRGQIMAVLRQQGRCLVAQLARKLSVSEVTIRQDLDALAAEGLLRRTHGGALLAGTLRLERPFQVEETSHRAEKERISAAALAQLSGGETVILDVGTTVTTAARKLVGSGKARTIVTNGLNIAAVLEADPSITTVVTGGTLRPQQHSLVNPFAELVLARINADVAFLGANGIAPDHGVTNVNAAEAQLKTLFVKAARRRILLADATKIGAVALAKYAEIRDIDLLITDRSADREVVRALRDRGLEVELA
jgi:DeoR family transcriptional regulator of aga operon